MLTSEFKIESDMRGFIKLEKNCKLLNKRHIRFGWYEGKRYSASHANKGISIAQVAYWQEYGMAGGGGKKPIPSRPYFRQAINKIRYNYRDDIKKTFLTGLYGNDMSGGLKKVADSIVLDYQKSVAMQNHESLSGYTVAKKGHNYQMFDSGVMMGNFKSRVYHQNQEHIKE